MAVMIETTTLTTVDKGVYTAHPVSLVATSSPQWTAVVRLIDSIVSLYLSETNFPVPIFSMPLHN
jgi:hypothetical protein